MTTSLQKQAQQSGLAFPDSSNHSEAPQWNVSDWPPLLDGWRSSHASIVLDHPEQDNAQTVVVLGGYNNSQGYTNSVLLMNLAEENKQWREGPPLNDKRAYHAAVVCNGGVYVIGGYNESSRLDTIERIDVANFLTEISVCTTSNHWTALNCRLSTARDECSAVTVYNRYIVVMGGLNKNSLESVDVIDTAVESNHTVIAGPSMIVPRYGCTSAVIGHRIYVVGGHNGSNALTSVESLEFKENSHDETKETAVTGFSSWATCTDLALFDARYRLGTTSVGSCIIVVGGISKSNATVEVLDTERRIVWNLPPLTTGRSGCSMVAFETGIAVIGGEGVDSCETLLLINKKMQLKTMFSCRAELDAEMEKLNNAIERATAAFGHNDDDDELWREGAKAQSLLPLLQSLCDDEKFWSSEQIQEKIDQLTAQIQNTKVLEYRIPMGRKLQHLKSLLEMHGVTHDDRKRPGRSVASTRDDNSRVLDLGFYRKLVEVDSDDIVFKVHDVALLVSDVHQMKVFYTFLNLFYRFNLLSKNDRQRYALKALQRTSKTICKSDHRLMTMQELTVQKCRQDGIVIHGIDKNDADSVTSTDPLPSLVNNLAMIEFRVGEMLPRTSIESQVTANTLSDGISHRAILAQVQAVGRSLKDFHVALEEHDHTRASIAAVCSILNSLSFGQALCPNHLSDNHGFGIILDEIVDYGDVHHICSVVDQSGNEKLQEACQEGLAIVERAMSSLSNDVVMGTCIENEPSKEDGAAGPKLLVTVMGYLANAVTKRVRGMESLTGDSQDGSSEAITLLALIVTAKMVQALSTTDWKKDSLCPSGGEPACEGDDCTTAKLSPNQDSIAACRLRSFDKVSSIGTMETESLSIFQRLSRLESSVGEIVQELRKERKGRTAERQSLSQLVDMQVKLDERMTRLEKMLGYSDK